MQMWCVQAHANNVDSLHIADPNDRLSSDSAAAGLGEANVRGLCSLSVGCKVYGPKSRVHFFTSGMSAFCSAKQAYARPHLWK